MEEAIVEQIQTKIAFLERANSDLSDVVFRQQQEIRSLGLRLAQVVERLDTAPTDDRQRTVDEERPPHY